MPRRILFTSFVAAALLAAAVVAPGTAGAQTVIATLTAGADGSVDELVTIPPGTPAGIYDLILTGMGLTPSSYPPAPGARVTVGATVVVAGAEVPVSGDGWGAGAQISVSLEAISLVGTGYRIAQATQMMDARARIRIVLAGTAGDGSPRSAGIVTNNSSSSSSSTASAAAEAEAAAFGSVPYTKKGVLARTGIPALSMLSFALASILLGAVFISAARRRRRERLSRPA